HAAAQTAALAAPPPGRTWMELACPAPETATSSIRSPTARKRTGAPTPRSVGALGDPGVRERVVEDLERVLALGGEAELLAGARVLDRYRQPVVRLLPVQRHDDAVVLPASQLF